jgi:hypothetical protein
MRLDELTEDDIGRTVKYHAYTGADTEWGIISRFTTAFVFVLFDGDRQPKATPAELLEFAYK